MRISFWEAATWSVVILMTLIVVSFFPWYTAENLLRYIFATSGVAAIFWYLKSRRLYRESQEKTLEIAQKQKEISAHQKTISLIFDNSADGILILDNDQIITDFSPGLEKITGYSKNEAIGKNAQELLKFSGDNSNSLLPDAMFISRSLHKKPYIRNTLMTKQGREIDVEASYTLISDPGKNNISGMAIIRDITYENELVRRDKEFIAITSHQLNTPLSIIQGYVSLIKEGKAGKVTETQMNYINEIVSALKKMIDLTNNLLSISRIEQNKIKLEKSDVNVAEIIKKIMDTFGSFAKKKNIDLICMQPKKDLLVYADQEKLIQALSNITSNAIKYTQKGKVELSVNREAGNIVFQIKDSGIGIAPEEIERIGEKFYRTQQAIDADHQGTGLGVFIAKTIIEKHGGTLAIRSVLNKGTTFVVSLPATNY